jgi:hypothetical protein
MSSVCSTPGEAAAETPSAAPCKNNANNIELMLDSMLDLQRKFSRRAYDKRQHRLRQHRLRQQRLRQETQSPSFYPKHFNTSL